MDRLNVLLFNGLNRDKAHTRSDHPLANRLRIIGVVLVALHVERQEVRCHELTV